MANVNELIRRYKAESGSARADLLDRIKRLKKGEMTEDTAIGRAMMKEEAGQDGSKDLGEAVDAMAKRSDIDTADMKAANIRGADNIGSGRQYAMMNKAASMTPEERIANRKKMIERMSKNLKGGAVTNPMQ